MAVTIHQTDADKSYDLHETKYKDLKVVSLLKASVVLVYNIHYTTYVYEPANKIKD